MISIGNKLSERDVERLVEAAEKAGKEKAEFLELLNDPELLERKRNPKTRFTIADLFAGKTEWSKHAIWTEHREVFREAEKLGLLPGRRLPEDYVEWLKSDAFWVYWAERRMREEAEGKLREINKIVFRY